MAGGATNWGNGEGYVTWGTQPGQGAPFKDGTGFQPSPGIGGGGSQNGAVSQTGYVGYGGTSGGTNSYGQYIPAGMAMDRDGQVYYQHPNDPAVTNAAPINAQNGDDRLTATRGGATNPYRRGIDDIAWANVAQPSAYQYGGYQGGASDEEERYAGMARNAQIRFAPQLDSTPYGAQYNNALGMANDARGQQQSALGNQQYGLGQLQNIIQGTGPSVAQQQQNMGLAQAMQQQASIAHSARGGGANLAAAQQAASNAAAGLSGNAFGQNALLRAQEQTSAINNYGNLANAYSNTLSGIRGQDQAQGQLAGQLAGQQAGLNLQARSANDSKELAYENMRQGVFNSQMGARQAGEAANAGVYAQNADRAQRSDEAARQERDKLFGTGATVIGGVAGTLLAPGPGTAAGAAAGNAAGNALK